MKKRIEPSTIKETDKYLALLMKHAEALIYRANHDTEFAFFLRTCINFFLSPEVNIDSNLSSLESSFIKPFLPKDDTWSRERVFWLIREIEDYRPESEARLLLSTWSSLFTEPEDVVFGIIGLAIIGPTLGLINKKKKINSLQIVFSNEFLEDSSTSEQISVTHSMSTQIVSEALGFVDGDAYRLEPELRQWLFSDRHLLSGSIKNDELEGILVFLENEKIPCLIEKKNGKTLAIAFPPTINIDIYSDFEAKALS